MDSILTNEKYKGDALLQKQFTVDFLEKKMKPNEGEVPQYYVKGSHPAIIDRDEWDHVQAEMERRKQFGKSYSGKSVLSAKLVCEDCGDFYGPKVWHSTDPHCKIIWRCNSKFDHHKKRCRSPTLDTNTIQAMFIRAYNQIMQNHKQVIADCELMRRSLSEIAVLDAEIAKQLQKTEVVGEMVKVAVKGNASSSQSQEEYLKKYECLSKRYQAVVDELERLKAERIRHQQQDSAMALHIRTLKKSPVVLDQWNATIRTVMAEKGIVHWDKSITFVFYNGRQIVAEPQR